MDINIIIRTFVEAVAAEVIKSESLQLLMRTVKDLSDKDAALPLLTPLADHVELAEQVNELADPETVARRMVRLGEFKGVVAELIDEYLDDNLPALVEKAVQEALDESVQDAVEKVLSDASISISVR